MFAVITVAGLAFKSVPLASSHAPAPPLAAEFSPVPGRSIYAEIVSYATRAADPQTLFKTLQGLKAHTNFINDGGR